MPTDKVIVTNVTALKAKYGSAYGKVKAALAALAASDKARGLKSKLVAIDSSADMKAVRGRAVSGPHDQRGAKAAIDAIAKKHEPSLHRDPRCTRRGAAHRAEQSDGRRRSQRAVRPAVCL